MPMQKFILPALRLVSCAARKGGRPNLAKNRSVSKAKFDRLCLNVKSKMHHVAVLNDIILAF